MRVLFNGLQAGNRSGTGSYTCQLARLLPDAGPGMAFDLAWPAGLDPPDAGHSHATCHPVSGTGLRRLVFDQAGLPRLARQIGADLIHFPANVGLLGGAAPFVVTVHDLSFFRNPSWFRRERAAYYRWGVGRSARRARRVIADSQATADDLQAFAGVNAERIDVVPLGVDTKLYRRVDDAAVESARERHGLTRPYVLYTGTLEPRKNIPRLLAAFARLTAGLPHDLVLAGRPGWKTGPIEAALDQPGLAGRVRRIGFVPSADLPALMTGAAAFAWPSLWEGFGLPPLDAMACGTPVLTSNVSSMPEVTGDAALLVDPEDVDAIEDGLRRLLSDESLRRELAERGPARARRFTWRRTAEMTCETYRKAARR